jgi:hypothetical protein
MADRERRFSIHDLLVALLRDQNIHEGYWGLTVQFEAKGTAVPIAGKPGENLPALAVAVSGVTLVPATEGESGAVDASLVNPLRPAPARKRAKVQTLQ